jgi:hypothetical protein
MKAVGFVLQGMANSAMQYREEVKSNAVAIAMAKSGYRLRERKISWPRAKAVKAVRIDCATGHAVGFLQ